MGRERERERGERIRGKREKKENERDIERKRDSERGVQKRQNRQTHRRTDLIYLHLCRSQAWAGYGSLDLGLVDRIDGKPDEDPSKHHGIHVVPLKRCKVKPENHVDNDSVYCTSTTTHGYLVASVLEWTTTPECISLQIGTVT